MFSSLRGFARTKRTEMADDRGDTLVEILVSLVVLGAAVVALLGGLLVTTTTSVSHRSVATINALLTSFAETARNTIQAPSGGSFTPCTLGNPVNYAIVGSPNPRSGPPGSVVDVLGTGINVTPGAAIPSAAFGGSPLTTAIASANSSASGRGAISDFLVPTLPAGTYSFDPFDSSHAAASSFTITPWVGTMNPPPGGSTGPGSKVNVSVAGFAANATLSVQVGATTLPVAAVTGNPIGPQGAGQITFTLPNPLPGSQVSQPVAISDGTNTAAPVTLSIATDTGAGNPLLGRDATWPASGSNSSNYVKDTFSMTVSYWNSGWQSSASSCTPGFNPNIQKLTLSLQDNQPNNGAASSLGIVVANFLNQSVPAPPIGLTALSYQNGQVPLSWNAPSYTGTSPITGYNIYRSTVSGSLGTKIGSTVAPTTTFTDTGRTNGTTYYYQVTAVNGSGEGAPSVPQASATPATTPGPPTAVSASPGNTTATITWSAPASNGGAAISSYNVYQSTVLGTQGAKIGSTTSMSFTATGLTNNTAYYYEVTAVNPAGEGTPSAQASATPSYPPGPPTGLAASPGNNQVQLSWTAPAPNAGPAVTGYNVYRSMAPGTQGTQIGTTSASTVTYTDSTAANGTTYYYEVTAVNAIGEGPASNQVPATPSAAPTVPAAPVLQVTGTTGGNNPSISLSWTTSSNGGATLNGYTLYRSTSGTAGSFTVYQTFTTSALTGSYTDTGVSNGTRYYYYVTAGNAVGASAPSNTVNTKP